MSWTKSLSLMKIVKEGVTERKGVGSCFFDRKDSHATVLLDPVINTCIWWVERDLVDEREMR